LTVTCLQNQHIHFIRAGQFERGVSNRTLFDSERDIQLGELTGTHAGEVVAFSMLGCKKHAEDCRYFYAAEQLILDTRYYTPVLAAEGRPNNKEGREGSDVDRWFDCNMRFMAKVER